MIFNQIWQGKNCRTGETFPASVPGNIQYDFAVMKDFGDIGYADNYKKLLPYEDDAWEYETALSFEANEGEAVFFVSDGIAYKYDVYLGDRLIYAYEGMFKSVELELEGAKKNDILKIHVYPHPKRASAPKGTRDEADESCNPPVCYGWDWNPRLLISGLWQGAHIETRGDSHIGGTEVLALLNKSLDEGKVVCNFTCKLPCVISLYDQSGALVYCGDETEFVIDKPNLWWCNGQGEPYLYRYVIANEKESVEGFIGFKRIRLVRNADANEPRTFPKGRYEAPITVELNGRRIFTKGSNWVNPDIFWGSIDAERYEKLISLAADANMNMLRMWGGAGLEKREFYELCDKYGILVWQEFMLACNNYKDKEPYMTVLKSEATAIIKKLRSHPSLAIWCGGNELFNSWSGMDDQSAPLRLLNSLCYEYDRERPFLPTSPLYGMAHGGYTFYLDRQGGEVYQTFGKSHNTAYTEFGVPSISSVESLKRVIPEDELFPPRETDAWIAHHGYNAWIGDTWLCLSTLESYFGKAKSLEELVECSSWLQCEGYRFIFEEARRQWPHCSMALNWCFDEPWNTAGNNSLVEYPTKPKPALTYVKNALRPTLFSAKVEKFTWYAGDTFEAELWLLNDSQCPIEELASATLTLGGKTYDLLEWRASAAANRNTQGPTVRFVLPEASDDRLVLDLTGRNGTSSRYTLQYKNTRAPRPTQKILNI